ncbi:unnamed protein product [Vitrella brassicaformis CCMP3155]|uniref:SSD domain-containing protein n=1 Tax=Vitrella brassicaformis (strain CCMP3155) TaxID=1169540 RepID=A0A0G4EE54_VITBC|nr:unnamed protein product [Vitrella brassicaformis CCMP3155]|eukprot:CEL93643.1 unnamed protein product [Vitrella brassicaformis CCMP3155]
MGRSWFGILHAFDHLLASAFYRLSHMAGRNKVPFILIPVALALAGLATFLSLMVYEPRMDALYFPTDSRAVYDDAAVEKIWGDQGIRFSQVMLVWQGNFDANVLTAERFAKAHKVVQGILTDRVDHDGKTVNFTDVCVRSRTPDDSCFLLSVFNGWNNETLPSTDEQLIEQLNAPTRVDRWKRPLRDEVPLLLAKAHYDSESRVDSAAAYHFIFGTKPTDEGTSWEGNLVSRFIDVNTEEWGESEGFRVYVRTEHSIDTEVERSVGGNLLLMSVVFIILIGYAVSVTYRHRNLVRSQMLVALTGVAIVGLSLCLTYGICALAGIPFTAVVGLSPFLILGIGVDNIFIIINTLHERDPDLESRERVSLTMKECGPSITMTTLTSFVAFAAGAGASFPVVSGFCIYTSIAILCAFLMTITAFLACVHLDAIRQSRNRIDLVFCKSRDPKAYKGSHQRLPWGPTAIVKVHLGPFLARPIVKALVVLSFLSLLAGGIVGMLHLEQGLPVHELGPYGSFLRAYYAAEKKLGLEEPAQQLDLTVSISGLDFTSADDMGQLEQLTRDLEDSEYAHPERRKAITSFVRAYDQWRSANEVALAPAAFYDHLGTFLKQQGAPLQRFVVLDEADGTIKHMRISVRTVGLPFKDQADLMVSFREVVDGSKLSARSDVDVYITHPYFFRFEQEVAILGQTMQTMLIAAAAVLVITFIFLSHPLTVLFVLLIILMIDANLMGYMTWWNVPLDATSMISLVLSIGFSVDYSAHLAHAFMLAPGTRDERMQQALSTMGVSIANGGMSTLLATLPLAGAPAYVFRVYFKMMFMSVVFGVLHGLLFLPVLLSLIGPKPMSRAEDAGDEESHKQKSKTSSQADDTTTHSSHGESCDVSEGSDEDEARRASETTADDEAGRIDHEHQV